MIDRIRRIGFRLILAATLGLAAAGHADPWALPAEGSCSEATEDSAVRPLLATGQVLSPEDAQVLKHYLPPEIWERRDQLLWEGMRLEIGPCHRDYSAPAFYQEATANFRGRAKLLENGGLDDYVAGLPFAPDTIDPADPKAGLRWAWNAEHRYRAGGHFVPQFRWSIFGADGALDEKHEGHRFLAVLRHRADRSENEYRSTSGSEKWMWVSDAFYRTSPWGTGEGRCRMYRRAGADADPRASDDHWVYTPELRRPVRSNIRHDQEVPLRFSGLGFRPFHYDWRVVRVQDVVAPINTTGPLFPETSDRNFGPSGLSLMDDRWDVRRALVLEGTRRDASQLTHKARQVVWLDLQTLFPLYHMEYAVDGELVHASYWAARWSEDRPDYPRWPDDAERPVRSLDLVAAFRLEQASGERHEMGTATAMPPKERRLQRDVSMGSMER